VSAVAKRAHDPEPVDRLRARGAEIVGVFVDELERTAAT
jgi:hypothetical protein